MVKPPNIVDQFNNMIKTMNAITEESISDWQRSIAPGDFCVQIVTDEEEGGPFAVFSKILDPAGHDDVVFNDNYRYGLSFSVQHPQGEYGGIHISEINSTLPRVLFDRARDCEWSIGAVVEWRDSGWEPDEVYK